MTDDPRAAAFEQLLTDEVLHKMQIAYDSGFTLAWSKDKSQAYSDVYKLAGFTAMRSVLVAALLKAAPPAEGPTCKWTEDGDEWESVAWDTDCGEKFMFLDGGPFQNHIKFCCYCGAKVQSVPTPPRDPAGKE